MGIQETRRYRAYLRYMTRNEFIEVRDIPKKEGEVRVETDLPVTRIDLPGHMGNRINIFI